MNPFDDTDLIDRLQTGIAARQLGVSAPDGIAGEARRAAHRQTATRTLGAGVPVLVAAGVATVLATSQGAPSQSPSASETGGSSGHGPALSAPVKVEDTAYIVRRVKAAIVTESQGGTFTHGYDYSSGQVSSDGSIVDLGHKLADQFDYVATNGTQYERDVEYNTDGSVYQTLSDVWVPDANGTGTVTRTIIAPAGRVYTQSQFSGVADPDVGQPAPNLDSTPSQVQQALQTGQVTQAGTATIRGTPTIVLSIAMPSAATDAQAFDLTLYVDAQSYQPLRSVAVNAGQPGLNYTDYGPASAANIGQAENTSIPADYTKVHELTSDR